MQPTWWGRIRAPHLPHRRAFVIAATATTALLLLQDFGRDPGGHPLQSSPLVALAIQLPLHALPLLGGTAVWAALHAVIGVALGGSSSGPRKGQVANTLHLGVRLAGSAWTIVTLLLTVLDLGMQRFRAEPLSWNHLAAYAGTGVVNGNWIGPVVDQGGPALATLLVVIGVVWALMPSMRGVTPAVSVREPVWWLMALPLAWGLGQLAWYHQRDMLQSAMMRLWQTRMPPPALSATEARAVRDELRRALDPNGADQWLSEAYPLLRRPAPHARGAAWGQAVADPPDIVVVAIESLRGRDTGWGYGGRRGADSPTPALDAFAEQGVRYPTWTAGGEPSPRGFITLHTGLWEHPQLFLTANFPNLRTDAFPAFLRRRGYRAVALWSASPSFDNQLGSARRWYDETLFDRDAGQRLYFRAVPDSVTVDRAVQWVRAHDAAGAGAGSGAPAGSDRPFVLYLATDGTHTPFTVPAGQRDPGTRQGRYDLALRDTDRHIARLLAALRARPRWQNTVVLVVGDHGERTDDDADPVLRGLPTDPMIVTSAILLGPVRLVGAPRVDSSTVGHLDWFPTVRAWFADSAAAVWMGRDLFDPASAARWPVAVNSRGYRRQDAAGGLLVSAGDPTRWWVWATGQAPQPGTGASPKATALARWLRYWGALVEGNRVQPDPDGR